VKFVVLKKKIKRDYLQHQEEQKIGKLSDEEKYISHKGKFEVKAQSQEQGPALHLIFYLITKGYLS